jgi:predicted nucleic acid-binding Zn ribbon protein
MECNNCHRSFNKNLTTCPYCGFNNINELNETKSSKIKLNKNNKRKNDPTMVTIVAIILIGTVLVCRYLMYDSKADDKSYLTNTTTKEVINKNEFKKNDLLLYFPLDFDKEKDTIYYIEDRSINVKVEIIDDEKVNEIITANEILSTNINNIDAKTYANNNNYGYLLTIKNNNYHIIVSYPDNTSEEILKSLNKIIESLKVKE